MCVLIVEDDNLIREMFAEYLVEQGMPVVMAENGDEAIDLIDNPPRRFSVLLKDFHMPGSRHGYQVAEYMKSQHPDVHLFIMTGRPDALQDFCGTGLDYDLLLKPIMPQTLHDRIAHLVKS